MSTDQITSQGGSRWSGRAPWQQDRAWYSTPAKVLVLVIACAMILVPFLSVVSTSIASPEQLGRAGGFILWPDKPSFEAYRAILDNGTVVRALMVSVGVTVVGTVLSLTATVLMAHALSRPGSWGHRPVLLFLLFTLLFGPGLIPSFLMVKQLGLLDSWWSLILPGLVSGFNVLVIRSFMLDLPAELTESARMDGAGEFRTLIYVVLPLSKAVIAVIGLFYAVGYWNAFFNAVLYLEDSSKWPLQLVLRTFVVDNNQLAVDATNLSGGQVPPPQSIQMAILMVALLPILLVYPFIQRHFTKGVLTGGVKG